jgi:glucokinase
MKQAIGIDLGGTTARAALVREDGVVVKAERRILTGRSPQQILEQVVGLVRELDPGALDLPAAMGIAAQLWVHRGVVAVAPNLGWTDVAFGSMLEGAFGHRVRLVNDLDAITVGEARRGAGRGEQDVMVVFVGTGVGLGVICQGALLEGSDGLATELGHTKIASPGTGRGCGCGERGCLEAYTSGRHLPQLLVEKAATGLDCPLLDSARGDLEKVNAVTLEQAALTGDPAATALWEDIAHALGVAIANAVTLLNPHVLVLGGGVITSAPSLRERIVHVMRAYAARPALSNLVVRDTELGDQAGLVGAGLLALES